jgi:hypothetical protein
MMGRGSNMPCYSSGVVQTTNNLRQRFQLQLSADEAEQFVETDLIGKSLGSYYTRLYVSFQSARLEYLFSHLSSTPKRLPLMLVPTNLVLMFLLVMIHFNIAHKAYIRRKGKKGQGTLAKKQIPNGSIRWRLDSQNLRDETVIGSSFVVDTLNWTIWGEFQNMG